MRWPLLACAALTSFLLAACSDSAPPPPGTATEGATNAAATYTATATATVLPAGSGPVVKTYARGETVDIPRGTLFLDQKTGGGEAWADVSVSPNGTFAIWNGPGGKEPPVLYDTLTRRRIALDTGGQLGTVLDFNADETEASVRVGDELRMVSTADGKVRITLPISAGATYVRAYWGIDGAVATGATGPQGQPSLGITVWWHGSFKTLSDVPSPGWIAWSPDGTRLLTSDISDNGWTAIIEVASGRVARISQRLYNPRWSTSGAYWDGQLFSGELLIFRADGTAHIRMNGVCAFVGSPWVGDEIITLGSDFAVAMDGSVRAYTRPANTQNITTFAPDNGVVLLDPAGTTTLAQLKVADSIPVSGYLGFPWVTPDGRAKLQLGVGGKGACENVGMFSVELLSSP